MSAPTMRFRRKRGPKVYCDGGFSGRVQMRRTRETGARVGVYHGEQSGMETNDTKDCKWLTVCEEHHNLIGYRSLRLAKSWAVKPSEWCEDCRTALESGVRYPECTEAQS